MKYSFLVALFAAIVSAFGQGAQYRPTPFANGFVQTVTSQGVAGTYLGMPTLAGTNTYTGPNTFSGVVNIGNSNAATWATNKLTYYAVLLTNAMSDTSFTNSTSETTILTYTMPAGVMGNYGKLCFSGLLFRNPAGSATLSWRFKMNGTILYYPGAAGVNPNAPALASPAWPGVAIMFGIGNSTNYIGLHDGSASAFSTYPGIGYDDSATTNVLTLTAQNGSASDLNACKITNLWLYIVQP